jgi:cobalt/nickel transport system permease protein
MHIPDSMISPATSAVAAVAMAPLWYAAVRRLSSNLATRQVPLLALGSAFSFTIMLFNVPLVGGTTAHAVGAVAQAVLLGPWAAILGVSTALAIQALFFGDGGVLALGANCLSMAVAMPVCGYLAYRAVAGRAVAGTARHTVAVAVGAYVGVNAAALVTAIVLGVQPMLHHDAAGRALYFPFDLRVTIPAMVLPHLTIAGFLEAAATVAAVRFAALAGVPVGRHVVAPRTSRLEWLWLGLVALVALAPLWLIAQGEAWGE